jgi:hypothetical protein
VSEVTRGELLSEEFAALHLRFAARVVTVCDLELTDALERWTPARRLSGEDWTHLRARPTPALLAAAYQRQEARDTPGDGCFSAHTEHDGGMVRIHFRNVEGSGALAPDRLPVRRRELYAALTTVAAAVPRATVLRCGSWLYHLPAYRQLFPPFLLATAEPTKPDGELTFLALWGQFLRGDGKLYQPRTASFEAAAAEARSSAALLQAFPLPKLALQAPLHDVIAWLASHLD